MGYLKIPYLTTAERMGYTPEAHELLYDTDLDTIWYGDGVTVGGIELLSSAYTGFVQSVTGLDTDNTDPQNPIVQIAVDGVTITGDGTSGSPLVATATGGGYTIVSVNFAASPYTIVPTSGNYIYQVDCTGGNITINFPTAVGNTATYGIKKIDSSANTITLDPFGAQTIDGAATATIRFQNTEVDIYSNNSNLFIK